MRLEILKKQDSGSQRDRQTALYNHPWPRSAPDRARWWATLTIHWGNCSLRIVCMGKDRLSCLPAVYCILFTLLYLWKSTSYFPLFMLFFFFLKRRKTLCLLLNFLFLVLWGIQLDPVQIRNCHLTHAEVSLLTVYAFKGQKYSLLHTLKQQWLKFFKASLGLKIYSLKLCIDSYVWAALKISTTDISEYVHTLVCSSGIYSRIVYSFHLLTW